MNGMSMIFAFHFSFVASLSVERTRKIVEKISQKSSVALALKDHPKSFAKLATKRRFKLRYKTRPKTQCLNIAASPAHRVYEQMQKRKSIISPRPSLPLKAKK